MWLLQSVQKYEHIDCMFQHVSGGQHITFASTITSVGMVISQLSPANSFDTYLFTQK